MKNIVYLIVCLFIVSSCLNNQKKKIEQVDYQKVINDAQQEKFKKDQELYQNISKSLKKDKPSNSSDENSSSSGSGVYSLQQCPECGRFLSRDGKMCSDCISKGKNLKCKKHPQYAGGVFCPLCN